ncbi:MAG TPA: PaaI family thioesterase [Anaeromyxobacteraceae bacterium]|nr:PaaI family thioesterase [Anaeromyxobacteraceae bacterium]
MSDFDPPDPAFAARVRASFARQAVMATIGAAIEDVRPGGVDIRLPFRPELTQQHGFLHAGVVTAILDNACGYAALTLMPAGAGVLSVEFKVNLLAPGEGEAVVARGRVPRAGRNIVVCAGDAFARGGGAERPVATMLATMMVVRDRPDVVD